MDDDVPTAGQRESETSDARGTGESTFHTAEGALHFDSTVSTTTVGEGVGERALLTIVVGYSLLHLLTQSRLQMAGSFDPDSLRGELERQLAAWSNLEPGTAEQQRVALETWGKYELLTSSLSHELCEQLRLVLEPTLATKLQ